MHNWRFCWLLVRIARLVVLGATVLQTSCTEAEPLDAFYYNSILGRGINLGNALEAPREGAWGVVLKPTYFQAIKEAGFNSVRIPIRWAAHASIDPPYTISADFFKRVDWAIEQALARDLAVIINVHHYEEMNRDPNKSLPRLLAIWAQIAQRYRYRPDRVYFELLNEPHDEVTDERWEGIIAQLLSTIRKTNPDRMVIVGPANWNDVSHLPQLRLPKDNSRLIVTFHYYKPFRFTHQGAPWVRGSANWKGTTWSGSNEEEEVLRKDFDLAADWATRNSRPLFMGEFGTFAEAEIKSRAAWTRFVAREAEKRQITWSYWEFGAGFGVYDLQATAWREPLLKSLIDR